MSEKDNNEPKKSSYLKLVLVSIIFATLAIWQPWVPSKDAAPPAKGYNTELVKKAIPPVTKVVKDYSDFVADYQSPNSDIQKVYIGIDGLTIIVQKKAEGASYTTYKPTTGDLNLVTDLAEHKIPFQGAKPTTDGFFTAGNIIMIVFVALIAYSIFGRKGMGGMGGAGKMGETKAKHLEANEITVRFADVAGVEEAVKDVAEVVDFLHNPGPYTELGAKIPRGVILTGPPGCGKTLLARAIAGEAGVPFFPVSGSEFVEMYVGVGAARVRDTFEKAAKCAPSIIFIDEIDAIGRSRSSGHGNNNDEREQTLNEILTKMDGFGQNDVPVIVLAATNRDDILDAALMRAGRFDRKVRISLPDLKGREQIIKVHTEKKPLEEGTDLLEVVRGMTGVSGADLANLANEAALIAVRRKSKTICANDFELAKDKVTLGEKSGRKMKPKDKRNTAYHEAGHAIIGYLEPDFDKCTKVSILPRANALGITQFTPEEDKVSITKAQIFSTVRMAYGGRAAEEIIGGAENITTGASNDIQRITSYLTSAIMQWGLSDKVGQLAYASEYGDHLAQSVQRLPYSENTAEMMDLEKRELSDKLYNQTKEILLANMDKMHAMADALLKWETIEVEQIEAIMEGREPPTPIWFLEPVEAPVVSPEKTEDVVSEV